tara:strand:+ start:50 stop:994 length:945 start_codon:yes stop_codon:yes gene_type:complete
MKKYLIKIYDIFLTLTIFLVRWIFAKYRKRGAENLPITSKFLKKIGLYPITNHYYEPKFEYSDDEKERYLKRNLRTIKLNDQNQIKLLKNFNFKKELLDLNLDQKSKNFNFYLENGSFEKGDAEIYYQMIRYFKPKKIIEVGCGHSTLIAMEAIKKNKSENIQTIMKCIEPYENHWLEKLDLEIIREPLEKNQINWSEELNENDIFFLDSSHIIKPDGDILKFYLEILPKLKSGVIIHIHDIFTPKNYLPNWTFDKIRLWNEQYLLEGILSNTNKYEVLLSLNHLKNNYFQILKNNCPYLESKTEPASFYLKVN